MNMSEGNVVIKVESLVKTYGSLRAVDNVSFEPNLLQYVAEKGIKVMWKKELKKFLILKGIN